jgi:hypothetical protein
MSTFDAPRLLHLVETRPSAEATDPPRRAERIPAPIAFRLEGISQPGAEPPLDLLAGQIGEDEAIAITYRSGDGRAALSCTLAATAATAEAAREAAARLGFALATGPFDCRAIRPAGPGSALPWQAELVADGLVLDPLSQRHPTTPLVARRPDRGAPVLPGFPTFPRVPFDQALAALVAFPDAIELALHLERVRLDAAQRRALEAAALVLAHRQEERFFPATDGTPVLVDGHRASLLVDLLRLWRRVGSGVRVRCRLAAAMPVPEPLARMIGGAVLRRGCRMVARDAAAGYGRLDLRATWPVGIALPRLLPAPATLHAAGLPRVYPHVVRLLAPDGIVIGSLVGSTRAAVRLSDRDRSRHVQILGATGAGKSTLMLDMLMQDIHRGAGLCLIDPHGDLFGQVLARLPRQRLDDVVVVDPSDPTHAVGLNLLEPDADGAAAARNFVVNEMIAMIGRLYDLTVVGGPMFETYMRNAMTLLLEGGSGATTLVDVPLVFQDAQFRDALLDRCGNPQVVNFWRKEALRTHGDYSLANMTPYITSKLNLFVSNAMIRPIIGQPRSSVDFRAFMDEGRIVLVNLAKGLLGTLDSRLLGMLVVGKVFAAALGRVRLPAERRRTFHLYVDECQSLITPTMAEMLAEARKFGLSLVLANQTLSQLSTDDADMLSTVLGNVGSLILMRLGPIDARRMAEFTAPGIDAAELQALPDRHAVARLLVGGRPVPPFVFAARPAQGGGDPCIARETIARSRRRYAYPIAEVEAAITARLATAP